MAAISEMGERSGWAYLQGPRRIDQYGMDGDCMALASSTLLLSQKGVDAGIRGQMLI